VDVGPVVITNGSGVSVPSFDSFVDDVIDRRRVFRSFSIWPSISRFS